MPITSSAIKAMRQSAKRAERRVPAKTYMKTMMRKLTQAAAAGNLKEAQALLAPTYKAIDMAAKKHLIHKTNAARKKSLMAKIASPKVVKK